MGACFVLECSRGAAGKGQEGAGVPSNTKNTRHVARFSCPGGGERRGEGGEAAEHKERAHMGTFFVLGCRGRGLGQESCRT